MKKLLALSLVGALAACGGGGSGGGGGGGNGAGAAEGMWEGLTSAGQPVVGFVLPSGSYYMFYGDEGAASLESDGVWGAIIGKGSFKGADVFESNNALDIYYDGDWDEGTITATVVEKQAFNGTATSDYDDSVVSFDLAYNDDWEGAPLALSSIAGTYEDSWGDLVTITADGKATYSADFDCTGNGTLKAGPGNIYTLSVKTTGTECEEFQGVTFKGILYGTGDHIVLAADYGKGDDQMWMLFAGER